MAVYQTAHKKMQYIIYSLTSIVSGSTCGYSLEKNLNNKKSLLIWVNETALPVESGET